MWILQVTFQSFVIRYAQLRITFVIIFTVYLYAHAIISSCIRTMKLEMNWNRPVFFIRENFFFLSKTYGTFYDRKKWFCVGLGIYVSWKPEREKCPTVRRKPLNVTVGFKIVGFLGAKVSRPFVNNSFDLDVFSVWQTVKCKYTRRAIASITSNEKSRSLLN